MISASERLRGPLLPAAEAFLPSSERCAPSQPQTPAASPADDNAQCLAHWQVLLQQLLGT